MKQMESSNSRIEILLGVIRNLLDDIAALIESCEALRGAMPFHPLREIARDREYIVSRVRHEGLSFLTVTMPRLGKWYDGLLADQVGDIPPGFKPWYEHRHTLSLGGNPIMDCGGFTCPTFCRMLAWTIHYAAGSVSERANIIRAYRSLFYLYYKLEVPFTPEQLKTALAKWKRNEEELEMFEFPQYYDRDLHVVRDLIADLLRRGPEIFTKITPGHGPGAVAGGEVGEEKWETFNLIPSLHRVYPRYDLYLGFRSDGRISAAMAGEIIRLTKRSTEQRAISKLLFVPKDSRGPRTICCEPKELMFVQQGISNNLMRELERLSHNRINFVDQTVNGWLALASSESQDYGTVDLQDASDRVTMQLIRLVFPDWAHKYLTATRSESTKLPDGSLHEVNFKYAPMGSALCFPIQSMLFWSLAVVAGVNAGLSMSDAKANTYVYGDDIIIRPRVFPFLCELFSKVGLIVNREKSYVEGSFRESCGVDAWKGYDVTPFKIKKDLGRRSLDGPLATAICEYSSKCFALDLRKTGEHLFNLVNTRYPGVIRIPMFSLGCLHVVDPSYQTCLDDTHWGWSTEMCCTTVRGWVVSTPLQPSHLSGLSRLLKFHYGNWEERDPNKVALLRGAKIRKRNILVEWL